MVVPFLPPDTYFSSLTSSLTIALFPLTRNFRALTICMENLVFKWKVHSGGMFSEKVNTFHAFTEFTKISVPFVQN